MSPNPILGRLQTLALLLAALTVSACSGSGPVTGGTEGPAVPETTYPGYETFDPAGYDAEAAPRQTDVEIVHDVPASVMAGRVNVPGGDAPPTPAPTPEEPVREQVEGYRVQVYASENRQNAERVRSDALRWWGGTGRGDIAAIVAYLQPYYRVRLGAFASREEADAALAIIRGEYPEAFLVPDVVPVAR